MRCHGRDDFPCGYLGRWFLSSVAHIANDWSLIADWWYKGPKNKRWATDQISVGRPPGTFFEQHIFSPQSTGWDFFFGRIRDLADDLLSPELLLFFFEWRVGYIGYWLVVESFDQDLTKPLDAKFQFRDFALFTHGVLSWLLDADFQTNTTHTFTQIYLYIVWFHTLLFHSHFSSFHLLDPDDDCECQ